MIGVIADDLTGAAEVAAVGWRYGLEAEVHTTPECTTGADLLVVDTDSRLCAPEEAARRVEQAVKCFRRQKVKWIYKKIDSVLRGPVLVEVEALLRAASKSRGLLVPCNPSFGRVIHEGRYWIGNTLIHETEFHNDPHHPAATSNVLEMLGSPVATNAHVRRAGQGLPANGITIGEASSKGDLMAWARKLDHRTVPVGAADFLAAILETKGYRPTRNGAGTLADPNTKDLFVCGSPSAATQLFISASRVRGIPVLSMPMGSSRRACPPRASRAAWLERTLRSLACHPQVLVAIDQPLVRNPKLASQFGDCLVSLVEAVLQRKIVTQICVEGGATASLLVRRMGWERLRMVRELAHGIASMRTEGDPQCLLTIKPGSYTWPVEIWRTPPKSPRRS